MRTEQLKEIEASLLALEDGINALNAVLPVLEPFDGKLINVKIDNALRDMKGCSTIKGYYTFGPAPFSRTAGEYRLKYHSNVITTTPGSVGPGNTAYYPQQYRDISVDIQMAAQPTGTTRYDHQATAAALTKYREGLERSLEANRGVLDASLLEPLEAKRKALMAEVEAYNKALPSLLRTYLDISISR